MYYLGDSIRANHEKINFCKGNVDVKRELKLEFDLPKLSKELTEWY